MAVGTRKRRGLSKPELAKRVGFDAIAGELAAGRDVAIAGFGKFSVTDRAA